MKNLKSGRIYRTRYRLRVTCHSAQGPVTRESSFDLVPDECGRNERVDMTKQGSTVRSPRLSGSSEESDTDHPGRTLEPCFQSSLLNLLLTE